MMAKLCVLWMGLIVTVDGRASLLARPPLGKGAAGFIVNESSVSSTVSGAGAGADASASLESPVTTGEPSFVSVGIRSGCAREKAATAATLRSKETASAASRLRGGSSWIPHPPVRVSRADLENSQQAKAVNNADPISSHRPAESSSSCSGNSNRGGSGGDKTGNPHGAEFTVAKQPLMADECIESSSASLSSSSSSFEGEGEGAGTGGGGLGGGGGGGGGGRVGSPSFPRALPAVYGKSPFNKKFAWVP